MPRRNRDCPPGLAIHIIQRGNNRQICFAAEADIKSYANWLREGADKYSLAIHAWVFMTNHVHLLLTPAECTSVSRCMQYLGRLYVRYFNCRYGRTGTLFEGRFKSSLVQNQSYFLACQRYIEMNPVRAGIVSDPVHYLWSSYRAHAFGHKPQMWKPHPEYFALGSTAGSRQSAYRPQIFDNSLIARQHIDESAVPIHWGFWQYGFNATYTPTYTPFPSRRSSAPGNWSCKPACAIAYALA